MSTTAKKKGLDFLLKEGFDPLNSPIMYLLPSRVYLGIYSKSNPDIFQFELMDLDQIERSAEKRQFFVDFLRYHGSQLKNSLSCFCSRQTLYPCEDPSKFSSEDARKILAFNCRIQDSEAVFFDYIEALKAYLIYAPEPATLSLLKTYGIEHIPLQNAGSSLLRQMLHLMAGSDQSEMLVQVTDQYFQLLAFDQGRLLMHNVFSYASAEDFIYFIMHVFHSLGLNPEKTRLHLCGELVKGSENFRLCYKYIRNLDFMEGTAALLDTAGNSYPRHLFYGINPLFV